MWAHVASSSIMIKHNSFGKYSISTGGIQLVPPDLVELVASISIPLALGALAWPAGPVHEVAAQDQSASGVPEGEGGC